MTAEQGKQIAKLAWEERAVKGKEGLNGEVFPVKG